MTTEQMVAFFVFAVVAAITPGPSNLMITATGSAVGILRGVPCVLGVAVGMGLLLFAVAMGLGQLVLGHDVVLKVLNGLGAAFLLWLAWKIATSKPAEGGAVAKPVGFIGAAAFQWINPKGWLVSVSATSAYLRPDAGSPTLQSVEFGVVMVVATLPSALAWLGFGASMQRFLRTPRAARRFNIIMGVLLAASLLQIFL